MSEPEQDRKPVIVDSPIAADGEPSAETQTEEQKPDPAQFGGFHGNGG